MNYEEQHLASLINDHSDVTKHYRALFNKCDKNKDGFVSITELKRFIKMQKTHNIPDNVIETIHSASDKNKDAQLDFYEFLEMLNNPLVINDFKKMRSRYVQFVLMTPKTIGVLESSFTHTGLYEGEQKCGTHTVGMLILSIVQILLFYFNLNCITNPVDHKESQTTNNTQTVQFAATIICPITNSTNGPVYEALKFIPKRHREVWRYVTHIFVHANEMHLFPNIIMQIFLGIILETVHTWRVLVIYLAGALGGCLAHGAFKNSELVGGSGGVYAFYTAHIASAIMNWREMSHPSVHLIIFGLITIFDPIYNSVIMDSETSKVSYIAHLGGAVVGLLLGILIVRNLKITMNEIVIWYTCLVMYVILIIVFVVLNTPVVQ